MLNKTIQNQSKRNQSTPSAHQPNPIKLTHPKTDHNNKHTFLSNIHFHPAQSKIAQNNQDCKDQQFQHYYEESFESYATSQIVEAIEEYYQSQPSFQNLPEEIVKNQQISDQDQPLQIKRYIKQPFIPPIEKGQKSQLESLSISTVQRMNVEFVEQIQVMRRMLRKYKAGLVIQHEQERQLRKLNRDKKRALDPNYEFQIHQQYTSNKKLSKQYISSIKQHKSFFNKKRYQAINDSIIKDPFDLQSLLNQIVDSDRYQNPELQVQLSSKRHHLLNIRKRQQIYESKIHQLQLKAEHYERVIDDFNSVISRGDYQKLQSRKQTLIAQIQNHQQIFSRSTINLEKQIKQLRQKIEIIDFSMNQINKRNPIINLLHTQHRKNNKSKQHKRIRLNSQKFNFSEVRNYTVHKEEVLSSNAIYTPKYRLNDKMKMNRFLKENIFSDPKCEKLLEISLKRNVRQKTTWI